MLINTLVDRSFNNLKAILRSKPMPEKTITGSTLECWFHYISQITPSANEAVMLSNQLDVKPSEAIELLNKEVTPSYLTLLKIRYLLESKKYSITSTVKQKPITIKLGKLIVNQKIDIITVCHDLSFAHQYQLINILLGTAEADTSTIDIIDIICSDFEDDIQKPNVPPTTSSPPKQTAINKKRQDNKEAVELLISYLNEIPKSDQEAEKQLITTFCDCKPKSLEKWLAAKSIPTGVKNIKLQHYLKATGKKIPFLEKLPLELAQITTLIAYGIINISEIAQAMEIESKDKEHYCWRILYTRYEKITPPQQEAIRQIIAKHQDFLNKEINRDLITFSLSSPAPAIKKDETTSQQLLPPPTVMPTTPAKDVTNTKSNKEIVIATLNKLLTAALPLTQILESNICSPQNRREFRKKIDPEKLFQLSCSLNKFTKK